MSYLKFLLTGLCLALLPHAIARAQPMKIRLSWIGPVTNWAPMLPENKDLGRHLGRSLVLEPVPR